MLYKIALILLAFIFTALPAKAAEIPWGVHLLGPHELPLVLPYRGTNAQFYVTVPLSLSDRNEAEWNSFFELALKSGITPIIRWVTVFSDGHWTVPSRKEIVDSSKFISTLNWTGRRYLVLFNEPNHAPEWGGSLNPEEYVEIAHFAASWLKTESAPYTILPAGFDAAAKNTDITMDSFHYIERMYHHDPEFFQEIDGWTSHAYPNPGFANSPYYKNKDSIWGFQNELRYLKHLTGRDYEVYVTETGWKVAPSLKRLMPKYYQYTVKNVWNDPAIKAVTLFVFRGFNGPFADFSLLNEDNSPTPQFEALLNAMKPN